MLKDETSPLTRGLRSSSAALNRALAGIALAALLLVASPASASNYYLVDLERFDKAQLASFSAQQVETTEQFLASALTERQRKALARKLKMSEEALLDFAKDCELMQIIGVGPKATRLLRLSGVTSAEDLATRKAEDLLVLVKKTNMEHKVTETDPNVSIVAYWIEQAARLPYRVN